ncbi:MAG: hypothetical protein IPH44_13675 [Myxococcales bacterium]|nr:hypothetical protein [Myxococcales bacterium]
MNAVDLGRLSKISAPISIAPQRRGGDGGEQQVAGARREDRGDPTGWRIARRRMCDSGQLRHRDRRLPRVVTPGALDRVCSDTAFITVTSAPTRGRPPLPAADSVSPRKVLPAADHDHQTNAERRGLATSGRDRCG